MLDLWQRDQTAGAAPSAEEGRYLPAAAGESFSAAWSAGQLWANGNFHANARDQAIQEYARQIDANGGDVQAEYSHQLKPGPSFGGTNVDELDVANTALAKLKAKNPLISLDPMSSEDIDRRANEISRGAVSSAAAVGDKEQTFMSRAAGVAGSLASGATDPYMLPLMAVAPEASAGILATALKFGATQMASQAVSELATGQQREAVQPGYAASGQAVTNIAESGIEAAALGGGLKVLGNLWTRAKTGSWPTSVRDAGNVVESEANLQHSNVLPGAEGEAAHYDAMRGAVESILKGEPVDVKIAEVSRGMMNRLEGERGFSLPRSFSREELLRTSEESALRERAIELDQRISELPKGDKSAAETLARVGEVERQMAAATGSLERRGLSERRDELLSERNPDQLREAAAPIEQRRQAENERAAIDTRLSEIAAERPPQIIDARDPSSAVNLGQIAAAARPPTLFDIHQGQIDNLARIYEAKSPVLAQPLTNGIVKLAQLTGHVMPVSEAEALTKRVLDSGSLDEAHAVLNEVALRPRTAADVMPSAADVARAEKASAKAANSAAPDPHVTEALRTQDVGKTLADPAHITALRTQIENAIDDAAKKGESLMIPMGKDDKGEPVFQSLTSLMSDALADERAAAELEACVNPIAEAT